MKHLLFKIVTFSLFSFLIMVSETPAYLKVIFISVMLFFYLPFRYEFFTKERTKRKFIAALSGTVVFTMMILFMPVLLSGDLMNFTLFIKSGDSLGFSILVFSVTIFYFLVYGLPVSLLSDWLAERYPRRMAAAGFVHFGFGMLLIGELWILPVICAMIFWGIDEVLQRRTAKEVAEVNK